MSVERLTDRRPALGGADLVSRFTPPRRFAGVRFSTYTPNPEHPSQAAALADLEAFAATVGAHAPARRFRLRRMPGATAPGRYMDGGFGVGKTHLLAAAWHAALPPKAYLTFAELTSVIGFLGMQEAVRAFEGYRLLCIDEFELDDVANTLMTVTFLRSILPSGVRVATTSNSLPDRLGEGRFNAEDFTREIKAIASAFEVVRIDGPDYRAATRKGTGEALDGPAFERLADRLSMEGRVSVDGFDQVLAHLRHVHPVQFGAMVGGLDAVLIHDLHPMDNQGSALLFAQLVDELYDAEIVVGATGCAVGELFPPSYRHGGYRKKYGRCESRLSALLVEATELSST
jgi:cell division protein ZapE